MAALGLFQAGAVLVPVNTRFKGAEAADILARSRARALVTVTDFLGTDYVAMLPWDRRRAARISSIVVVACGPAADGDRVVGRVLRPRHRRRAGRGRPACGAAVGPDDPCDILFTSGTTGVPKGVVQTHGGTTRVATDWVAMTGLDRDDRYLMVNPYFHMFGLKAGILAAVGAGATMLPEPVFDVDRVLARVADERVTVLPGAPTLYQGILDHPDRDRYDLSTPAGGRDRRRRHPRRADPPGRRRAPVPVDHHRLRADRGRHGGGHLARRRCRDHRHHRRATATRVRAAHRRRAGA